jgi:anti-sigma factor RsiW
MADLHVNALASTNLVDVVSTDRHTVKPWFQGKIPFSFNLPEFSGTEYTLLGGRLVYFHQTPGAQLIVAMRQHKISVLIFQESPEMARAFSGSTGVRHRNSFGIETWESQGLRFVIISDAEPAGIDKLAASLKQANQ